MLNLYLFGHTHEDFAVKSLFAANKYILKVNNRNARKRGGICGERCVVLVTFELYMSPFSSVFVVDFELINVCNNRLDISLTGNNQLFKGTQQNNRSEKFNNAVKNMPQSCWVFC